MSYRFKNNDSKKMRAKAERQQVLTMDEARIVRWLYHDKKMFGTQIARIYKVNAHTINRIVNNVTYKEVV